MILNSIQALFQILVATLVMISFGATSAWAADRSSQELKEGQLAPDFSLKDQNGKSWSLSERKGTWTVLYFYPKSETPGCTRQACTFRDQQHKIKAQGAEVIGVSVNSTMEQLEFSKKHRLNFTLLADEEARVSELYGAKMPLLKMAKRWTFILNPYLQIVKILKDVDPVKDSESMAALLIELKNKK